MNTNKDFCRSAGFRQSKPGKLKDVCRKAFFFTEGHFDFNDNLWKSGGKIIDDSRWYIRDPSNNDFRIYPVLLDRFAYVKTNISQMARDIGVKWWTKITEFTNNCEFRENTDYYRHHRLLEWNTLHVKCVNLWPIVSLWCVSSSN